MQTKDQTLLEQAYQQVTEAVTPQDPHDNTSMNTTKKTDAEKQLIKFRNQLHNLLIKYPDIRITGDEHRDVVAWIRTTDTDMSGDQVYLPMRLPKSGKQ